MARLVETSIIIDARYYKDAEGNLIKGEGRKVPEGAVQLVATPNQRMTLAEAQRLGIEPADEPQPEPKAKSRKREEAEDKAQGSDSTENKAQGADQVENK